MCKPFLLYVAALGVVGSFAHSQSEKGAGKLRRAPGRSLPTVHLDLETGTITRGPVVKDRTHTTISTFPNLDLGGFVGADTGGGLCEWIDTGVKPHVRNPGGGSQFLTGFTFAYCSAALDTSMGGPGGTAELFFREGYTLGGANQGTEVARIKLTGMPANTSDSSFFGGFRCFFFNVDMGTPFCFLDGPIGYGWRFVDIGTDGAVAATWLFTSYVQSGTGPGPDGLGVVNYMDKYCPPGNFESTFYFECDFCPYFTSISMDLREHAPHNFPTVTTNGTGINPATLTDIGGDPNRSPRLGTAMEPFGASLTCNASCTYNKIELRAFSTSAILTDPGGTSVELLCAKPKLTRFKAVGDTSSVVVPLNEVCELSFFGVPYCTQGFCFGCTGGAFPPTSVLLSNALMQTVDV